MLVLSRKVGESIVLPNEGVTISVVAVNGRRTRLGIVAPRGVAVRRSNVLNVIPGSRESHRDLCEANGKPPSVPVEEGAETGRRPRSPSGKPDEDAPEGR